MLLLAALPTAPQRSCYLGILRISTTFTTPASTTTIDKTYYFFLFLGKVRYLKPLPKEVVGELSKPLVQDGRFYNPWKPDAANKSFGELLQVKAGIYRHLDA